MSQWGLSLSTLANQAEAFLEHVDKRTADSLVDGKRVFQHLINIST